MTLTVENKVAKWVKRCGFGVNPSKSVFILFTRKRKVLDVGPPGYT